MVSKWQTKKKTFTETKVWNWKPSYCVRSMFVICKSKLTVITRDKISTYNYMCIHADQKTWEGQWIRIESYLIAHMKSLGIRHCQSWEYIFLISYDIGHFSLLAYMCISFEEITVTHLTLNSLSHTMSARRERNIIDGDITGGCWTLLSFEGYCKWSRLLDELTEIVGSTDPAITSVSRFYPHLQFEGRPDGQYRPKPSCRLSLSLVSVKFSCSLLTAKGGFAEKLWPNMGYKLQINFP